MTKEYLKMADVFDGCVTLSNAYVRAYYSDSNSELRWGARMAGYAAHAINSHDELVAEVERLRKSLLWAMNNLSFDHPYEWSDNENTDAHYAALSALGVDE